MSCCFYFEPGLSPSRWVLVFLLFFPLGLYAQPGSLDPTFAPGLSAGAQVYAVALQADGKILVGGKFESIEGEPRANLARLNPDGTLDQSFNPTQAADIGYVNAITIQEDGKILIGGAFYSSTFQNPSNLARLNEDGSVDPDFDISFFLDGPVNAIALQEEGFIIIAGGFQVVDGFFRRDVARLFPDGTLEMSFDACVASTSGAGATALAVLPDGKLLVTGKFTFAGDRARDGIARLLDCGDLDDSYAPQPGIDSASTPYTLALQTNGNVYLGGDFYLYHNLLHPGIVELDTNGLPADLDTGTGFFGGTVYTIIIQHDQKLIVGGNFGAFNFAPVNRLVRLNPNGSLDTSFDPGAGPDDSVSTVVLQDGKLLVAGKFSTFDGVPRAGLACLNGDSFAPRLFQPEPMPGGGFRFLFRGEAGRNYSIQATTNLVDWLSITNVQASTSAVSVADTSTLPRRFYRAVALP